MDLQVLLSVLDLVRDAEGRIIGLLDPVSNSTHARAAAGGAAPNINAEITIDEKVRTVLAAAAAASSSCTADSTCCPPPVTSDGSGAEQQALAAEYSDGTDSFGSRALQLVSQLLQYDSRRRERSSCAQTAGCADAVSSLLTASAQG